MNTQNPLERLSRIAGSDVTIYRFVKEIGDDVVDRCDTEGEIADGVAGNTQVAGDEVLMYRLGDVLVEAGEAMDPGDEVMTNTVGRAMIATGGGTNYALGKVRGLTSAAVAGDLVSVSLYAQPQIVVP